MKRVPVGRSIVAGLLVAGAIGGLSACSDPKIQTIRAFRSAKETGDLVTARTYLSNDPRLWYGDRDGEGVPWTLGQERWRAWDEHFNGRSWVVEWDAEPFGRVASAVFMETNDFYALTERGPTPVRLTWYFDQWGFIEGRLVSSVAREAPRTDRFDDFVAWSRDHAPDELDHLMPGGAIDPTGDRPERMRRLLERWRTETGLPPIG